MYQVSDYLLKYHRILTQRTFWLPTPISFFRPLSHSMTQTTLNLLNIVCLKARSRLINAFNAILGCEKAKLAPSDLLALCRSTLLHDPIRRRRSVCSMNSRVEKPFQSVVHASGMKFAFVLHLPCRV